jgi:hypothetical protein
VLLLFLIDGNQRTAFVFFLIVGNVLVFLLIVDNVLAFFLID